MEKMDYFCKGLKTISTLIVVSLLTIMSYSDFVETVFLINVVAIIIVLNILFEALRNYRVRLWHCNIAVSVLAVMVSLTIYYT